MIRLNVDEWCQNCPEFDAETFMACLYSDNNVMHTDAVVKCKHQKRCQSITQFLASREKDPINISSEKC